MACGRGSLESAPYLATPDNSDPYACGGLQTLTRDIVVKSNNPVYDLRITYSQEEAHASGMLGIRHGVVGSPISVRSTKTKVTDMFCVDPASECFGTGVGPYNKTPIGFAV
ncbi:hypothetical protein N9L68_00610 [bacterium]|nr:hypothetical protein [bacterium]